MKIKKCLIVICLFSMASCNRVIYYGRTYTPTMDTDLYFRESDVGEPFEEIGKAMIEVSARRRSERIQKKFLRKAHDHGADAILFDDIDLTNIGRTTGGAAAGAQVKRGLFGIFGSKSKITKGQRVKVTFLKYKKNLN